MKKAYTKPELYFESFQLSANIATCDQFMDGKANSGDPANCSFSFDGIGTVFSDGCDFSIQDSTLDFLCYHGALAEKLFGS